MEGSLQLIRGTAVLSGPKGYEYAKAIFYKAPIWHLCNRL